MFNTTPKQKREKKKIRPSSEICEADLRPVGRVKKKNGPVLFCLKAPSVVRSR